MAEWLPVNPGELGEPFVRQPAKSKRAETRRSKAHALSADGPTSLRFGATFWAARGVSLFCRNAPSSQRSRCTRALGHELAERGYDGI